MLLKATVGAKDDHAKSLSSCLIAADHRGHFSHGLNRLGKTFTQLYQSSYKINQK